MNVIGEKVKVLTSSDPTKTGKSGRIVLETAKTLLIDCQGRTVTIEKRGTAFQLLGSGTVLTGSDIEGRLQDRWGKVRQ
jgi:RNase P/RNase MRP subunit p29